jgi:hypothetical protein
MTARPTHPPRRDRVGFVIGLVIGYTLVTAALLAAGGIIAALVAAAWWLL